MYDLPSWMWALVLAGVVGIPVITCTMLYRGAVAAGHGRRPATTVAVVTAAVLGGWLVAGGLLASTGVYRQPQPEVARPWLLLTFLGVLVALLAATRIPQVARSLADPGTPRRLVWPHTLRVAGVVFLIAMAQGHLPAAFALPAGLGDIAVGVAAPFVARRMAHGGGRRGAVWFNVLGILDLVVAVTTAYLAGLGAFRPLEAAASTEPLGLLPLALIPMTAVPLALVLHTVSLRRLRATARTEQAGHPLPAAG